MFIVIKPGSKEEMKGLAAFREVLKKARNVVALTGAGTSAESGVPTFRGAGGLWGTYNAMELATPQAFHRDPALVWQFYHYRRELVLTKNPNPAHYALGKFEEELQQQGKEFTLITQNIDELHQRAGSRNIIELHGALFKVRCTKCREVTVNKDSPICEALANENLKPTKEQLPHCGKCGGMLRPHIVWFGENLEPEVLKNTGKALEKCDLCLVVGTSSVVYPAAMFAPELADRGVPVAEFNIEVTPGTEHFQFLFEGPAGQTLPKALDLSESS